MKVANSQIEEMFRLVEDWAQRNTFTVSEKSDNQIIVTGPNGFSASFAWPNENDFISFVIDYNGRSRGLQRTTGVYSLRHVLEAVERQLGAI